MYSSNDFLSSLSLDDLEELKKTCSSRFHETDKPFTMINKQLQACKRDGQLDSPIGRNLVSNKEYFKQYRSKWHELLTLVKQEIRHRHDTNASAE